MIDAAEDVHVVDRANAWAALRDCDFEKAAELFENIIFKDRSSHEAHWGRALALAGIIYVTDFHENRRVPTCNNITESSFLESRDVKTAIELAPADIAETYRAQAEKIEAIRAEWMRKASKEPPYDVFICFKDSDRDRGLERTDDSYEAQNLYHALKEEGYKVFFSRESLRGKVSEHYEPYIYNALKTAKVMIVYGQNTDYFSAVWVKNEWLRFRNMIERGEKSENSLVVAYKGIDPADLPTGLRSRQCMNAAEFTFFDDLKAHIKSVIRASANKQSATPPKPSESQPKPANSYVPRPEAQKEPVKKQGEPKTAIPEEHFMSPKAKKIAIVAAVLAVAIIFGIAAPNLFVIEKTPEIPIYTPIYTEEIQSNATEESLEPNSTEKYIPPVELPSETTEETEPPEEFVNIDGLSFWLNSDGASYTLTAGTYSGDKLTIPETCNGFPVTAIGNGAFENRNAAFTELTIPDSITTIGDRAFYGCTELVSVYVGDGVTKIGKSAFYRCDSLVSVSFGETSRLESIGENAFALCTSLAEISFPEGVVSVGNGAFGTCSSLVSISLPDGVEYIGTSAFTSCSSLECAYIGSSITAIGDSLFYNCGSLSAVNIPDTVTSIENNAFYRCESLATIAIPEGVSSIGEYAFRECTAIEEITLPESLETLGNGAFFSCTALKSVILPIGLTSLGASAFGSCSSLESVTVLAKLESIPYDTFFECTALKLVTLPETVTTIGERAFENCPVETVIFDGSWEQWDEITFRRGNNSISQTHITCKLAGDQLDKLRFEENEDGGYTVYNNGAKGDIVIPATYNGKPVTAIGEEGFRYLTSNPESGVLGPTYLTSITIPVSVVSIGNYAFSGCADLETVIFEGESKLKTVGDSAFASCSSLESIDLPSSLESIGNAVFSGCDALKYTEHDNALYLGNAENPYLVLVKATSSIISSCEIHDDTAFILDYAFGNCNVARLVIPAGVKGIGIYAFSNCTALTDITLPYVDADFKYLFGYSDFPSPLKNVTILGGDMIPGSAFANLGSLQSVTIPASVKTIGKSAFANCTSLVSVNLPEELVTIDESAFEGCVRLVNIVFPASLETIGKRAFSKCTSLGQLAFAEGGESRLKTIGFQAFSECTGLTFVTLPDSLESIGDDAFWKCAAIEEMTLPFTGASLDGTESLYFEHIFGGIGDAPQSLHTVTITKATDFRFTSCPYIKNITIPDNVTEFADGVFSGCKNLEKLNIPSGLKTIGSQAFYGCSSLGNIELPDTLESIGGSAFRECGSFTEITVPDSVTYIGSSAFTDCDNLASLTVPFIGETRDAENGNRSSEFCNFFFDNVSTSYGCVPASLKTVIITDALHICDSAFDRCGSIESITVNGDVTEIGQYAFRGCYSLKSLVLSDSIESIGDHAFDGCAAIEGLSLPESLKTLGSYVFNDCTGLGSVTIRDSVIRLGFYMFSGCTNLKTVNYTGTEEDWAAIGGLSDAEIPMGCEIIYNYVPTNE